MKLWSNLFFLIPFALALSEGLYLYSMVLGGVFALSLTFHLHEENKIFYYGDMLFSGLLMFTNFLLLFMSSWALPYSVLAVACAGIAIFFFTKRSPTSDNISHGLWHMFSAGVSLFCLLGVI